MTAVRHDCVFDCNVLFQALISDTGPSAACVRKAAEGRVRLFISRYIVDELLDLCHRPKLQAQFDLTPERGAAFVHHLRTFATFVDEVPEPYLHPFDPNDSHYVNLALATGSQLVISRDRHLRNLMDATRPDGRDFQSRYPHLRVVAPEDLLDATR